MVHLLGPIFLGLEGTRFAKAIAGSTTMTAGLSGVHLVGFTLLMGGAIVSNLRLAGLLFPLQPVTNIRRPAERGMLVGLAISITTGFLLFSGRASEASQNQFFQLKMSALAAAFVCQFVLQRRFVSTSAAPGAAKAFGAIALLLWFSLAAAACAFILLD